MVAPVSVERRFVNLRPEFPAVPCFISRFAFGKSVPIPTLPPQKGLSMRGEVEVPSIDACIYQRLFVVSYQRVSFLFAFDFPASTN